MHGGDVDHVPIPLLRTRITVTLGVGHDDVRHRVPTPCMCGDCRRRDLCGTLNRGFARKRWGGRCTGCREHCATDFPRRETPSGIGSAPSPPWESGFTHAPPPTADGERTGPPDFVGIGAQKSGTTWWFGSIVAHPGVFHRTSIHKERHFFARFATEPFGPAQVGAYHAWFPRPAGTITGEWTPDYLCQPWVAPLLCRAAPMPASW